MTIQIGDKIPAATLNTLKDGVQAVDTAELFDGKKVVLFAVPGAFTPTCSAKHLPGYADKFGEFQKRGIDPEKHFARVLYTKHQAIQTQVTAGQLDAGADFIVTPGTPAHMADALAAAPLPVVPGAASPTELLELVARGFRICLVQEEDRQVGINNRA